MPSPTQPQSQEEGFVLITHKVDSNFSPHNPPGISSSSLQQSIHSRPPSYSEKPKSIFSTSNANSEHTLAPQTLHNNAGGFARLQDAVQSILSYLDTLNPTVVKSQECQRLSAEVCALNKLLQQSLKDPGSGRVSDCAVNIALSMKLEAKDLDAEKNRGSEKRYLMSYPNKGRESAYFRKTIYLLRALQSEIKMGMESSDNSKARARQVFGSHPSRMSDTATVSPIKWAYHDSTFPGRRLCAEGTCTQTLSELADWATSTDGAKLYWMTGPSGSGKTTISATFSHKLEGEKRLGASFFCSRASPECRQVNLIFPTIAYQLARYSMTFRHALSKVLKDPKVELNDIASQFERLLKNPLGEIEEAIPKNLVVVLDALDECENKAELKRLLDLLILGSEVLPIKFFITTRPEALTHQKTTGEMADFLDSLPLRQLEDLQVQKDIKIYLKAELGDLSLTIDQIEHLAHRSRNSFVYATVLARSIRHFLRSIPLQSLMGYLFDTSVESTRPSAEIDELYQAVLRIAMSQMEGPTGPHNSRLVLMVISCAQELVDIDTISELTGIGGRGMVLNTLHLLRPLLSVLKTNELVSAIHSSFSEFLFDRTRSGIFFCDSTEYSQHITRQCFEIMEKRLYFNICGLDSSQKADARVENFEGRVQAAIPTILSYSCRYWGHHLHASRWSDDLQAALQEFLCTRLLFWMEAMNLKHLVGMGANILLEARQWVNQAVSPDLKRSVEDARAFVECFATTPASQSTPHIYISALLFCPHSNFVSKYYKGRISGLFNSGENGTEGVVTAVATWRFDSEARSIAYSCDETHIAVGCSSGAIEVRYIPDGTLSGEIMKSFPNGATSVISQQHYNSHTDATSLVALSHCGKHIASSSHHTIETRAVIGDKIPANLLEGHSDRVLSLAFSPGGHLVASGSQDFSVRVWNPHTGALISGPLEGHYDAVSSVMFSPGGRRLASGSCDNTIRMWDPYSGALIAWPFAAHTSPVSTISFSPNGAYIVSGSSDGTVGIWDSRNGLAMLGTGVGPGTIRAHTGPVYSAVFSSDIKYIITSSQDQTVKIWDAPSGELVRSLFCAVTEPIVSLSISPGGKHVALCSDGRTVQLWGLSSAQVTRSKASNKNITHRAVHPTEKSSESFAERWTLRSDGWIVSEDSSLLLWVPLEVRTSLPPSGSRHICTILGCMGIYEVNLGDLPLGGRWRSCYKSS